MMNHPVDIEWAIQVMQGQTEWIYQMTGEILNFMVEEKGPQERENFGDHLTEWNMDLQIRNLTEEMVLTEEEVLDHQEGLIWDWGLMIEMDLQGEVLIGETMAPLMGTMELKQEEDLIGEMGLQTEWAWVLQISDLMDHQTEETWDVQIEWTWGLQIE